MKKILVPIAFNEHSQGLFDCAVQISRLSDATIVVLSIINSRDIESVESIVSMGYDVDSDHYVDEIRKDRKQKLGEMVKNSDIDVEKVKITFRIGQPVDEILKVIKKEAPDLVVMGTRGRSNLTTSVMGSVAEKVFKRSPVNVLSYRDEEVRKNLDKKISV